MIFRVSSAPSVCHPGAGQAALELHKKFDGSTFAAIRSSYDEFLARDDDFIEVVFNNPRRLKGSFFRNIILLGYRCVLLLMVSLTLISHFRKLCYRILHVHSPMYSLVVVYAKLRRRDIQCILSIHGSEIHHLLKFKWITRNLLRVYDDVFFVSQADLSAFEIAFPNSKTRFSYVGNGYNQEVFQSEPKTKTAPPFHLLILGSLRWQKNQTAAIEALSNTSFAADFHLNIVGTGPDFEALEALVNANDLAGFVSFHGQLPARDVAALMATNEFILSSSVTEGFPKAILEGMASGLVPIVPDVGEMPYLCRETEGFVFPKPNALEIQNVLDAVRLITPETFCRLSEASIKRANEFSWSNYVARHKDLYRYG